MLIKDRTKTETNFIKHALKNPIFNDADLVSRRRLMELPICPSCERVCMFDRKPYDPPPTYSINQLTGQKVKSKPYVTCPQCQYHGPSSNKSFKTYVKEV